MLRYILFSMIPTGECFVEKYSTHKSGRLKHQNEKVITQTNFLEHEDQMVNILNVRIS